jgi:NarL family two-component system sensor histidine kinase YdfH
VNFFRKSAVRPYGIEMAVSRTVLNESRIPIMIWTLLVYGAGLAMQVAAAEYNWMSLLFFTGFIALHASISWHSSSFAAARAWLYFIVQALIIYSAAYLVKDGAPAVLIGLYSALIGQSAGVLHQKWRIVLLSVMCYTLFLFGLMGTGRWEDLLFLIVIYSLMNVVVVSFSVLYYRQVHARSRTQSFLRELEKTHRKVEELTLASERQRMARDLHDTLAQGLTGLLMQLDAVDAHLSSGNGERAKQIVNQSMQHARMTLAEARLAIGDLRASGLEGKDFADMVQQSVNRLITASKLRVEQDIPYSLPMTSLMKEHMLDIINEAVSNTIKHAAAERVQIKVYHDIVNKHITIQITDDGVGFSVGRIRGMAGHYGLAGIHERARLLGGKASVKSQPGLGTVITADIPCTLGDDDD